MSLPNLELQKDAINEGGVGDPDTVRQICQKHLIHVGTE